MNAHEHPPHWGAAPALHPGLWPLIDRGILARAELADDEAFEHELADAVSRGEVTPTQAQTMGQMLGVRADA